MGRERKAKSDTLDTFEQNLERKHYEKDKRSRFQKMCFTKISTENLLYVLSITQSVSFKGFF